MAIKKTMTTIHFGATDLIPHKAPTVLPLPPLFFVLSVQMAIQRKRKTNVSIIVKIVLTS